MKLKNKIALITGGSRGIGFATAKLFLDEGATVIITSKNSKKIKIAKKKLPNVIGISTDITKELEVKKLIKTVIKKFKRIDILVNNAGILPKSKILHKISEKEWNETLDVNLTGHFRVTKHVIPYMQKNNGGSIINISSTYGILSPDQRIYSSLSKKNSEDIEKPIGYSVSKSGILNLTRFLATKFASQNIRVNTLTLGGVYANNPKQFVKEYSLKTPLGRMADKSEYIGPMIFLASNASSYMTGSNLIVDGGWSAW